MGTRLNREERVDLGIYKMACGIPKTIEKIKMLEKWFIERGHSPIPGGALVDEMKGIPRHDATMRVSNFKSPNRLIMSTGPGKGVGYM